MNAIWQDVRYGLRSLGNHPGFTAIAILTLALGIGANTGIFSVLQQVLLQRLPVPHPEQLVLLYSPGPKSGHVSSDEVDGSESFSYPMYKDLCDQAATPNGIFSGLAARASSAISLASRGQTERAIADLISGNYFDVLVVHPALGRTLRSEDTVAEGGNPVLMLGYGYWQKHFGGDPRVLNESVLVNNQAMTIVGVVQRGFDGVQPGRVPDVYIPITMKSIVAPSENALNDHRNYWINLVGRLKPGISRAQAMAGIAPTYHALLASELPLNDHFNKQDKERFAAKKIILKDGARGRPQLENDTKPQLLALMALVILVLLIACSNVAALQTARGAARQKEIGVRLSLGASRWQIIRQLIVESSLLSLVGALLGLVIASWISSALVHYASANDVANGLSSSLSFPVLLFAGGMALLSGLFFGIAPAVRATRVELVSTLKEQSGGLSSGLTHAGLRKGLVITQVALALLLVTAAGGFVRSLYNLKHVDLGLQPTSILQFSVAPSLNGYNQQRSLDFFQRLEDRISALPGVRSLSGVQESLLSDSDRSSNVTVEGEPPETAGSRDVMRNAVGIGHFSNLGVPLLQGREFTRQDAAAGPDVAIVNETLAKAFFPNGNALGRHMKFGGHSGALNLEIVGIVRDSHHMDVKEHPKAFVYIPYTQENNIGALTYYVRTSRDPAAMASAIRRTVEELDASLPVYEERTFEEQIDRQLSNDRLVALLATLFGGLAALLAAVGIYGLLAYSVTQRTREIGVRMALGASTRRVGNMILGEVAELVGMGVVIGLPMAYGLGRLINSLLYDVRVFELLGVVIALVTLGIVALAAGYLPARRAAKVDPMVALRYE